MLAVDGKQDRWAPFAARLPGRDYVGDQLFLVAGCRKIALVVIAGNSPHARQVRPWRGDERAQDFLINETLDRRGVDQTAIMLAEPLGPWRGAQPNDRY